MASDFAIRHAVYIIRNGGVIAYPTDTIYGLGCDPYNEDAVETINLIKNRPLNRQFILLAANIEQIRPLVFLSSEHEKRINQTTEATSWVLDAKPDAPPWLIDKNKTLAIRISRQPGVQRLCLLLGHPVISTSANPSGKSPAKNTLELHKYFHHIVDKILISAQKPASKPSKIIRLCDNLVFRP